MSINEQIVVDKNGKPLAVQIPVQQYKKMLEMIEEIEDIKAYRKAKKAKSEWVSFEEAFTEIENRNKSV
jgi:PHD/YefM family antitoxin component YafN of YafNO toxin-antitoxin module